MIQCVLVIIKSMVILVKQKKLEISNGNHQKRIVEKNVAINFIIMKLKDFIYIKKTKESHLLGALFFNRRMAKAKKL